MLGADGASSVTSHSSHSGTHGCDQQVTPTGSGSAPLNRENEWIRSDSCTAVIGGWVIGCWAARRRLRRGVCWIWPRLVNAVVAPS